MARNRARILRCAPRRAQRNRSAQPAIRNLHVERLEERTMLALVGAYSFNEGAGTSVADLSGSGNVGTTSNTTWSTAGKYGGALSFNGTSSRVNIVDSNSLDLTTAMTLEAWVRPSTTSGWRNVILKERTAGMAYGLYGSNGPNPGVFISTSTSTDVGPMASSVLAANTWSHIAGTYDGTTVRLYVNGALVGSQAATGNILATTGALRIGGNAVWGEYFSGLIDEVRIYNTALTQTQIQTDMNTPVSSAPDTTPPTVTSFSPANGAANIATNATVTVTVSEALSAATVSGTTVLLMDGTTVIAASVSYNAANSTVTLTPSSVLTNFRTYTIVVRGGASGVKDLAGNPLAADVSSSFTTALPSLTISDASVVEGNAGTTNATFTVTLSAASAQTVTVSYTTADVTATAGSDYVAIPPTILTFDPGQTVKTIAVAVQGDLVAESNETFALNLSSPTNAVLADAQGVGTIIEDEATLIGSEGFGYSAYTLPYEILDLVPGATGVTTIRSTGDNNTDTVTLASGNTFNFYGTSYTSLTISTNGLITFGGANTSGANSNLTSTPTQRSIAPLWDDWINTTGNAMVLQRYQDTNGDGINDRLIFEWNNVQGAPTSPSPVTFQAILQLNTGTTPGTITFNYPDLDAGNALSNGGSATVGIKDTGTQGTRRLLVSFNSATSPYVGTGKAIRIAPDAIPPSVALAGLVDGATVTSTVTLNATAADNIGIAGVQFLLDGVNLGAEDTTTPYSFAWNTATASRGTHTLTARARDVAGNLTTSAAVSVEVVPQLIITAPANNATLVGPTINVTYTTSGDLLGVNHPEFTLDNSPVRIPDSDFDGSLSLTNVSPGTHTLTGILNGNNRGDVIGSNSALINFTVQAADTTPPTVTVAGPANGSTVSGTVALTATAADNVGVAGVQFILDGTMNLGPEDTTSPYSYSWNTATLANGTHTISARARDAAANSGLSNVITVTVNNSSSAATVGQWSSVMNWNFTAINSVLLYTGKVLMWDGGAEFCIGSESARVWDPATDTYTPVPIPDPDELTDIFCCAQTVLADGRVLIVGGHECNDPNWSGQANAYLFDPATMQWTILWNAMTFRRWYPTVTTLPDGRALVTSGSDVTFTSPVTRPEVFDPRTNTFTLLAGANLSLPNYPFMFVLPNGNVLAAGAVEGAIATRMLNVATQTWTTVDSRVLEGGSAVMYQPGKIMKAGSAYIPGNFNDYVGLPSSATTYIIDTTQPSPTWQQTASMANPRTDLNLTLLPDGNVIAIGGSRDISGIEPSYGVLPAEMWSPVTNTWTTMASMQIPRMYHSTAVLLPDGRVLSAGGKNSDNGRVWPNAQIYSPPYLFKGARPTVTSAPSTLAYGGNFFVQTPDATSIASVSLIRNSSVTHSTDMDQRFVPLTFTQGSGGLNVQAPANANLAPPGYYMLFIVNSNGVPSIAPMVRLPAGYEDSQAPSAPTGLTASGGIGTTALNWSAATDNTGVVNYNVYRSTTAGFTPSAANRIAQPTTTSYTDTGLASGTYYYLVTAQDAAGNIGAPSLQAMANVLGDTTAPTVSITGLANGVTVSGTISINATAGDDVGVAGVQFLIDGSNLGAEDTAAPYTASWNTGTVSNGTHTITARARDTGGNLATSATITVTVSNAAPSGLVLAMGFNEGAGTSVTDFSGAGNGGTTSNTAWSTAGKYGGALSFNGTSSRVNVVDSNSLDLTTGMTLEAWVRPTTTSGWRDVILKERTGGMAYGLYGSNGPNPGVFISTSTSTDVGPMASSALAANTWSHIAGTYDGATVRFYVNGALVGSQAATGNILATTGALRIGGNAVWGEYFSGLIDEVRIYSAALTQTQIQADMNTPIGSSLVLQGQAITTAKSVPLTTKDTRPMLDEAVARWQTTLGDTPATRRLKDVHVQIVDLPQNTLAIASSTVIFLDIDAAGHGWFRDRTPWDDSEFAQGVASGSAKDKADLLSVLAHELGHILGMNDDHQADPFAKSSVMADSLPLGVRRTPVKGTLISLLQAADQLWAEFDPFGSLSTRKRTRSR